MSPRETADGFTLLEALAAVAVTAAILSGLAAVAGQWLPHWRHGFTALQNADLIGLGLDRIGEDVSSAEYARLEGGKGPPLFRGADNSVVFARQEIGPGAAARLEIVRIGVAATASGDEVERAHTRFIPGASLTFGDATTLLRPPFHLAFAYAGPDGQWRGVWDGQPKLPRAVRLTVLGPGGAIVTSTAVALKVTAAPEIAAQPLARDADVGNPK